DALARLHRLGHLGQGGGDRRSEGGGAPAAVAALGLARHVGHALGGGEEGLLARDAVEQGGGPAQLDVLGVPHVVAQGDGEVVQLDGGVEVVEVAHDLETTGQEQRAQGGGGEVLGAGVGPHDRL